MKTFVENERLLRRKEAARYLSDIRGTPVATETLARMAVSGDGPVFHKFGWRVLYLVRDLDSWADARSARPGARPPTSRKSPMVKLETSEKSEVATMSADDGAVMDAGPEAGNAIHGTPAKTAPLAETAPESEEEIVSADEQKLNQQLVELEGQLRAADEWRRRAHPPIPAKPPLRAPVPSDCQRLPAGRPKTLQTAPAGTDGPVRTGSDVVDGARSGRRPPVW